MVDLVFLPILAAGLLALMPLLSSSTATDDETDDITPPVEDPPFEDPPMEDPPVEDPPVEETGPDVTIAINGDDAVDALTREGGTELLNGGAFVRVLGSDDADVIIAAPSSDPDLMFQLQAGDDEITVRLGQDVDAISVSGDAAPSGADTITLTATADEIAEYQDRSDAADTFRDLPPSGVFRVGPEDTVSIEIDPEVEGRLVEIVYTSYFFGGSSQEPQSQDYRGLFLVPDGVDVEARIAEEDIGAPDENGDFLIFEDGAIRLASVALGGTTSSFDAASGQATFTDWTFEWDGLIANREIETVTINNSPI